MEEHVEPEIQEEVPVVQPTGGEEPGTEPGTGEPAEPVAQEEPKKDGVEKKIAKLTYKRREAEREAEYWRDQAMQQQPQQQQQEQPDPNTPPSPDSFENYDDYLRATARFEAKQEFAQEQQRFIEQQQVQTHQQKVASIVDTGNQKYTDFDELTRVIPLSEYALMAATESDKGADVVYYLGKNPAEASRISTLSPVQQMREVYRIEAQLSAAPPPAHSEAPDPIAPVKSTGPTGLQYSPDMSDAEYAAWRAQHKQ